MQKVINVLAVLSFVGTAGIIGTGTVVYLRRDAIAESVKERVAKAATEAIAAALPGMFDAAMPELPGATGGVGRDERRKLDLRRCCNSAVRAVGSVCSRWIVPLPWSGGRVHWIWRWFDQAAG